MSVDYIVRQTGCRRVPAGAAMSISRSDNVLSVVGVPWRATADVDTVNRARIHVMSSLRLDTGICISNSEVEVLDPSDHVPAHR